MILPNKAYSKPLLKDNTGDTLFLDGNRLSDQKPDDCRFNLESKHSGRHGKNAQRNRKSLKN